MGKALGFRLLDSVKEVTELEMAKEQLSAAIYKRETEEKIKEGMNNIANNLKAQAEVYGVKIENYSSRIKNIQEKYFTEINKIKKEYELQYVNMQLELRENLANKKIAIVNAKKMSDMKSEFMKSEEYQNYLATNPEFVKNTFLDFENKREMSIKRFYSLDSVIKSCEEKLNNCINETYSEIDRIIKENIESSILVVKENAVMKIVNKIVNIFAGKSKFESKISNIETNMNNLSAGENEILEKIRNNTIQLVAEIQIAKDKLSANVA
jgi:hypothetical protein